MNGLNNVHCKSKHETIWQNNEMLQNYSNLATLSFATLNIFKIAFKLEKLSQPPFTCSKLKIETLVLVFLLLTLNM